MKIRTLIVDDEPLAREGLELGLTELTDIDVIGRCEDGPTAVAAIRELAPDLVFLDIRMPGCDGFAVIDAVGPEKMPAVIFLTAFEEFALHAFRVNAIDYLLKPIDSDRLRESVARAKRRILQEDLVGHTERLRRVLDSVGADARRSAAGDGDFGGRGARRSEPAGGRPHRFAVRSGGRVRLLEPDEITWVEADGDYVTVHTSGQAHLVRSSMKSIEAELEPLGFKRIHRSSLVNLRFVRELIAHDSGDHVVVLRDGTELRMSRNYRDAVYAALRTSP